MEGTNIERIFIDGSHTIPSGKSSGIERVVRSLVANSSAATERLDLPKPQLVTQYGGLFYQANSSVLRYFRWLAQAEANPRSLMPRWYVNLAELACCSLRAQTLRKWILPQAGHLGALKLPHSICSRAARSSMRLRAKPVSPTSRDLFILPDAYWTQRNVWEGAAHARSMGATVAAVIYDLIPLTHPEYVGKKRTQGFQQYIHHAIENSDLLVAISKTVQTQVEDYIREHRDSFKRVPAAVTHFVLGAELQLVQGEVRPSVRKLFAEEETPKTFLMVATFDPRKNHRYVLDAFDMLWQQGQDVRLCLVGRVGALCDDVIQRVKEHPALGKQLFAYHDMQDAELQHCYQHCRGVLFPSIVEGFGLPIVESLWFGKDTFASNTPIHREVGGEDCTYFELDDPKSLADLLVRELNSPAKHRAGTELRKPVSWEASTYRLLQLCAEFWQRNAIAPSIAPIGKAA
jgi:glycosyltransferase involved in cell wall biosynthesis